MITKKISLLAAILAICASHPSFTAENSSHIDDKVKADRYAFIEVNFNSETNQFEDGYFREQNDLDIVKEHKATKEKRIAEYQKSWVPLLLKTVGTGFAINTGVHALDIIYLVAGRPKELTDTLLTLQNYMRYPVEPMHELVQKVTRPVTRPIVNRLNEALTEQAISETTHRLGWATAISIKPLLSASIAALLFKKANSYQESIDSLKIIIEHDDQMIQALEKLPVQSSP